MEREVRSGDKYRHFKGGLYQVVTVAEHTETGEKLVIYQALYGDYAVYARPLEMFLEEVDMKKYPHSLQRYRFEKVELGAETLGESQAMPALAQSTVSQMTSRNASGISCMDESGRNNWQQKSRRIDVPPSMNQVTYSGVNRAEGFSGMNQSSGDLGTSQIAASASLSPTGARMNAAAARYREEQVDERLIEFLDTDDLDERYNILVSMRDVITDHMINSMAVVMDVAIPDGDIEDRYEALKSCIRMRQRYEATRMR